MYTRYVEYNSIAYKQNSSKDKRSRLSLSISSKPLLLLFILWQKKLFTVLRRLKLWIINEDRVILPEVLPKDEWLLKVNRLSATIHQSNHFYDCRQLLSMFSSLVGSYSCWFNIRLPKHYFVRKNYLGIWKRKKTFDYENVSVKCQGFNMWIFYEKIWFLS